MRKCNIPIFIPHRGCPHDCAFCSQKKITGVDTEVTPKEVRQIIKNSLKTIDRKKSTVEVAFFGGSFTGLPLTVQEEFLKVVVDFMPDISGIRLSTRPDYINDEILSLLKRYKCSTIELGVQSSNDQVLKLNDRGHNFQSVIEASEMIKKYNIELGHQMMLGMYGSNPQKDLKTVEDIIGIAPSCVRIYPVITLKGTKLEEYLKTGSYTPYSVDEAAQLAKKAILAFRAADIDVIRLGLHSSEELEDGETIVDGPYHPAFGEIVESLIFRDEIEKKLLNEGETDGKLVFECEKNQMSKAVGHKKMNKIYFKEKYNVELCVLAR